MAYPTIPTAYGFKPVNLIGGQDYVGSTRMVPIASGYATQLNFGDLIQYSVGSGIVSTIAYNTAAPVVGTIGVFLGCEYTLASGPIYGKLRSEFWPASTVAQDAVAYIADDPDIIMRVAVIAQSSAGAANTATAIGALSPAYVGTNASVISGAGQGSTTGNSSWGITSSTAPANGSGNVRTTTTLPFRIVGLVPDTQYTVSTVTTAASAASTTVTIAANTAVLAGMQLVAPSGTGTLLGNYAYVTNNNGGTLTVNAAVTLASGAAVTFVGYPEALVKWNFGYHSYYNAVGV